MALGPVKEVRFPVSEALRFSVESIRKRFTRALITAISVVLGVAFFAALKTSADILGFARGGSPETQAYQLWMAIISLVLCAVGILNSMLMAVTERTKEIGTMKCLGAMDGHILAIFLAESTILGLIGGGLGAVAGWGVGLAVSLFQYEVNLLAGALLQSYLVTIGQAVLIAIVLSLGATLYPAYHAASLDPADALRYEV